MLLTPGTIPSLGRELQLILRLPETLDLWPKDKGQNRQAKVTHKIAIQDGSKFPTFFENVAHVEVGYFHKILVSTIPFKKVLLVISVLGKIEKKQRANQTIIPPFLV